jgi:predicted Fe-Mo cluster-binding NifX family protein
MKILITAQGPSLDSEVDARFGRGAFYLLVNTDNLEHVALDNESGRSATQGAGVQAAQRAAEAGAEALLTGHVGPKAHQTLTAAGIAIYSNVTGTVREAVESFRQGTLQQTHAADVEGRWQ